MSGISFEAPIERRSGCYWMQINLFLDGVIGLDGIISSNGDAQICARLDPAKN
jgi:hypothetical protein